jgi:hypothetical protein
MCADLTHPLATKRLVIGDISPFAKDVAVETPKTVGRRFLWTG